MDEHTTIVAAGNTWAPALAILRGMGYTVTTKIISGDRYFEAESSACTLMAMDLVAVLGLAKLYEVRGGRWQPTDEEVSALLALEGENEA